MRLLLKLIVYAALIWSLVFFARRFGEGYELAVRDSSNPASSQFFVFFVFYLLMGVLLGVVVAWDISHLFASAVEWFVFNGGVTRLLDPRLLRASRLREEHRSLDAIGELREYLADRPHDWQAASRIAEIYAYDLNNSLAAALEYETILNRRLPRIARPWVMLRLADSYLRLHRGDEAIAILKELIKKYPRTAPAEKAARRLRRLEPNDAAAALNGNPPEAQ